MSAKDPRRKARLGLVHQLAAQQGLIEGSDDTAYRDMLEAVTGHRSAAQCSIEQLDAVIDRLKGKRPTAHPGRPNNTDTQPQIQKIEALLADAKLPWAYALAIVRKQCGKDRLEFCTSAELRGVIAALTRAAARRSQA